VVKVLLVALLYPQMVALGVAVAVLGQVPERRYLHILLVVERVVMALPMQSLEPLRNMAVAVQVG
jgi:hypothetical protein